MTCRSCYRYLFICCYHVNGNINTRARFVRHNDQVSHVLCRQRYFVSPFGRHPLMWALSITALTAVCWSLFWTSEWIQLEECERYAAGVNATENIDQQFLHEFLGMSRYILYWWNGATRIESGRFFASCINYIDIGLNSYPPCVRAHNVHTTYCILFRSLSIADIIILA